LNAVDQSCFVFFSLFPENKAGCGFKHFLFTICFKMVKATNQKGFAKYFASWQAQDVPSVIASFH
jgi:hypothetical protein